ncbi:hypothetical protein BDV95DRAFT_575087 [Massariosphaeria phaeospora]|uniref:Uncharacterized protein n=1 Tax=Massariosphaeria phaeospora TaxID=100035 RepID=A0A7C8M6M8_9PLEO|nr:hypothetical protein BDV95DRAFT_575087 [Massariosphaeria phaeospora]
MNDAPPYSPNATSSETRLPYDYQYVSAQDEDGDPFESLARPKPSTAESSSSAAVFAQQSSPSPSSVSFATPLRPTVSTPARLAPTFIYSPELPPGYAPVDELARSFRLAPPFIYTTKTSAVPRYQLMQEFSRSGRPSKLHIRRLLASETRSASLPTAALVSDDGKPRIRYDEEGTMYSVSAYDGSMRGHRSSTIGGLITLETVKGLRGGRTTKIHRVTKNRRRDSLNPENEARMQRYGYQAKDEWDKNMLFCVKRGEWEDDEGVRIAVEGDGRSELDILARVEGRGWWRDLVVSCWVMRVWASDGLRWEGDVKGW